MLSQLNRKLMGFGAGFSGAQSKGGLELEDEEYYEELSAPKRNKGLEGSLNREDPKANPIKVTRPPSRGLKY